MAFQRTFMQALLVALAASSVAAAGGRSLLQFGKGKGIGMQATSVSVAQPMNLAPMPVAPLMYGGYGMPMAAPMAAGPTYVPSPAQKLGAAVGQFVDAASAAAQAKAGAFPALHGAAAAPAAAASAQAVAPAQQQPIYGAALSPVVPMAAVGVAAPMLAGGIQYEYVAVPVGTAQTIVKDLVAPKVPKIPELPRVPELPRHVVPKVPNVTVPQLPALPGKPAKVVQLGKGGSVTVPAVPELRVQLNPNTPEKAELADRLQSAAQSAADRARDAAQAAAQGARDAAQTASERAQSAAQAVTDAVYAAFRGRTQTTVVQPATIMTPVPVRSVVPVVSSAVTMPAYMAHPKGKGFFG